MKKRGGWGRVELPSQDVSDPRGVELHLRKVRALKETLLLIP